MRHNTLTLPQLLTLRAQTLPDHPAYTFLRDGESVGETLTFAQLQLRALALAERLAASHPPGSRAIILDPLGLDFFTAYFGSLYAGLVPVPTSLPNRQRGLQALRAICVDCTAACILSSAALLKKFDTLLTADVAVNALTRVAVDEMPSQPSPGWRPTTTRPSDLAVLQYTSGTTGTPRGVMVTHANMLHNQQQIEHSFGHDQDTVVVSWLPLFHDMGLGTALQGVWLGVHCVLMSPSAFVQKPLRWLAAISKYRGSFSGGPDFAYDLCLRKIDDLDGADLDLSCWTGCYNGSEPVRATTVERFISRFSACGLPPWGHRAVYGLAEATLLVTGEGPREPATIKHFTAQPGAAGGKDANQRTRVLVSCGRPWLGTRVVIVDPVTLEICRPGCEGEIWVGGQSVGAGYWQRPEESEEVFRARTAQGDGPFLRTGDLGFLEAGGLYVTGRLKDLIIVRGENHYPQDIEMTVSECHPALEPQHSAAFAVEGEDGEELVIVQEVKRSALRHLDADDVFRAIRGAVSNGHSLHTSGIVLVRPATLPRTSSGKVQRRVCARAFQDKSLAVVAEWCATEAGSGGDLQPPLASEQSRLHTTERLIRWLRKNMPERVSWNRNDELTTFNVPLVLDLAKQGLIGMQIDPRHGGLGLGHSEVVRVLEQLAALDLGMCLFIALNNSLGIQPIAGHADEQVKNTLLPQLVAGTAFAGFAFMEPGGGSTPNSFSAVARAEAGGHWRLFGTKCLHGQSQRASVVNMFVRHEESPAVSAFVIDVSASGLHVSNDALRRGVVAGLAQDTVVLDGVLVSSGNLLGSVGGGMEVARQAMLQTRLAVGAACLGMMKRCAQLARRYSPYSGRIHGKLTPNPVTLSRFGSLAARITTLETLVQRIARAMDQGRIVPAEAFAICKIAGPDLLLRAADDLMQLGAQRGADEMKRLSLLYGQAGFLRTLDGPPEPVSELIGALLMEEEGRSLNALIETIFRAPEVVGLLDRIVHSLRERLHRSSGALTRRGQRWSHTRAGELVTWVVLVAAVEGARSETPSAELARAATWARAQFEFALSTVELSTPSELAALEASDVADSFAAYAHTIGDLSDDTPREPADTPPPMGYWEPLSGINPSRGANDSPAASRSPLTRADLTEFVVTWLSQRVRLPVSKIDGARSFADHGLDSIASVELAKALSDRLGVALDETLLWNFATIDELLDHLMIEAGPPLATRRDAQDSPLTAELDLEIARLELELKRR